MDLVINRRHVNQGVRDSSDGCPTALALRSVGFIDVQVTTRPGRVQIGPYHYGMPKRLLKAIDDYDAGKPFRVGVYRIPGLERPEER